MQCRYLHVHPVKYEMVGKLSDIADKHDRIASSPEAMLWTYIDVWRIDIVTSLFIYFWQHNSRVVNCVSVYIKISQQLLQ